MSSCVWICGKVKNMLGCIHVWEFMWVSVRAKGQCPKTGTQQRAWLKHNLCPGGKVTLYGTVNRKFFEIVLVICNFPLKTLSNVPWYSMIFYSTRREKVVFRCRWLAGHGKVKNPAECWQFVFLRRQTRDCLRFCLTEKVLFLVSEK